MSERDQREVRSFSSQLLSRTSHLEDAHARSTIAAVYACNDVRERAAAVHEEAEGALGQSHGNGRFNHGPD